MVIMRAAFTKIGIGLHFRPDAYRLLYNSMMDLIQKEWPDQAPDSLDFIFPAWPEAPK